MLSTRTFGIELEVHLPASATKGQLAAAIRRQARVNVRTENYNHATQAHWKVTTDGSLGSYLSGAEVVSPVLSGEEGIQEARRVTTAIRDFGCTISVRCGFHVHVNAADLSLDQLRTLAINFVHCETAFDAIVPPSRRRDLNTYILSNRTAFGGSYDNDSINRAIDAYASTTTRQDLIGVVSSSAQKSCGRYTVTRYRKLNLTALDRYGTVEFRQHSGTVEPDKVENWVRLCVAFVERSKDSRPRKRPSTTPHVAGQELSMLLRFVRAEASVRKFYHDRRRKLSDAQLQRDRRAAAEAGRPWLPPAE